ncbi:MAG: beta-ketoacyl synthase N-terminal-like domain-containing protein [Janthinobacterium lividum]
MAYVAAHNIFSPLGATSAATFAAVAAGRSAVAEYPGLLPGGEPVWAARLPTGWAQDFAALAGAFSPFELMLIASIRDAAAQAGVALASARTVFVFATTKGNIGLLDEAAEVSPAVMSRLSLAASAQVVARYFGSSAAPVVISNACISGVAALLVAQRLLASGQYDTAVVAGADTVSEFVLAGFRAFQALSAGPCKPFSADRDGINLGEAAATIILTTQPPAGRAVRLAGGAISNDANHISGPSRTGAELAQAIGQALAEAKLTAAEVDFVSAHGTATPYNDAMEAKAFALSGVHAKPVFSAKGALGHTLGAAGLVESVLSVLALAEGCLLPTAGYSQPMQPEALHVSTSARPAALRVALKTASGFGGCNGALVFVRE